MKKTQESKGYGSIRKLKGYGAVGVLALGMSVAVATHNVSADEVTTSTDDTITQVVASQPESTNDNNAYAEQAGTSQGTLSVDIDNSSVENAATEASNVGVDVTKESDKD